MSESDTWDGDSWEKTELAELYTMRKLHSKGNLPGFLESDAGHGAQRLDRVCGTGPERGSCGKEPESWENCQDPACQRPEPTVEEAVVVLLVTVSPSRSLSPQ